MKSDIKKSYLSILVCCVLIIGPSVGYVAYRSHEVQAEHIKKMEKDKERLETVKSYRTKDNQSYAVDVAMWTLYLKAMPASQARTDYSKSIVKATEDNIITDEEYLELESGYEALELSNKVNAIKEDLGTLIDDSKTNETVNDSK